MTPSLSWWLLIFECGSYLQAAHRDVQRTYDVKERIARAMSRAAVSITITSLTDMIAFATGTNTSLPAIGK